MSNQFTHSELHDIKRDIDTTRELLDIALLVDDNEGEIEELNYHLEELFRQLDSVGVSYYL